MGGRYRYTTVVHVLGGDAETHEGAYPLVEGPYVSVRRDGVVKAIYPLHKVAKVEVKDADAPQA